MNQGDDTPRQMPHNVDAEVAVLAPILLGQKETLEEALIRLTPDHFYNRSHAMIFSVIQELAKTATPIDVITVTKNLTVRGVLEEVGGVYYLSKLTEAYHTEAHADFYIGMLREDLKLRQLIGVAHTIEKRAYDSAESKDLLGQVEQGMFSIFSESSLHENQLESGVIEFMKQVDVRENSTQKIGIQTPLKTWNEIFGGLLPGIYYGLGGRPGTGKSAMAEQFAMDAALNNIPGLYVSVELRGERLVGRMAAKLAKVNLSAFLRGGSHREDRDKLRAAAERLRKAPMHVMTPFNLTGTMLRSEIRRLKRLNNIQWVVLDYFQLLAVPPGMDRYQGLGEASSQIRMAINETGVSALILVQLNREAERESRPRMGHIREAGQVEQDADAVALLSEDKEKPEEGAQFMKRILNVDKNRDGATCEDTLCFDGKTLTFFDSARSAEQEELV